MSFPPALPSRAPPRSPKSPPANSIPSRKAPSVVSRWPPANAQADPPVPVTRSSLKQKSLEKPEPPPTRASQRTKSVVDKSDSPAANIMAGRPLPNPTEPEKEWPLPKPVVVEKERPPKPMVVEKERLPPKPIMVEKEKPSPLTAPAMATDVSTPANGDVKHTSFGASLHSAHEALAKKHEDELIALESLRFHIFNRAKQDKSYAEELSRTNQRASKKAGYVSNPTSPIFQAWLCFLEMSEDLQKQISNGAAQMSGVLLQTVDQLIRDKRGAKTVFDREQTKIDNEKKASCNSVQELRKSYRSHSKKTEQNKTKLETSLAKTPPKVTEQDRNRKRFVSSADKLHACHNDYALSIMNANQHIQHHRESLIPYNLNTLQQRMELQIRQWREVMLNYSQAIDFSQTYAESFKKLYECLDTVQEDSEYTMFVEDNSEELSELDYYTFDATVLESPVAPKVDPGNIVIDNLTHIAMKTRLSSLESDLEQHAKDLELKQEEVKYLSSTDDSDGDPSSPPTTPANEAGQQPPKHVRITTLHSEIRELECKEARKQDQAKIIKEAVEALGSDPPPLFDLLGEGVDPVEIDSAAAASLGGEGATLSRTSKLMTLKGGMKGGMKKFKGMFKGRNRGASVSSGGEGPTTPDMTMSISHDTLSSVGDDEGSECSSNEEENNYEEPPEIPIDEEEWYFGDIDRRLAESKVKAEGDYIIRHSERQNKYVLTCKFQGAAKHFVIQTYQDQSGVTMYRFEAKSFPKLRDLLNYHTGTSTPVTRASGAKIGKPVSKHDKWALQHSDIKKGRKIGKGAFGDVFEAILIGQDLKVAVKTCRSVDVYDMEKFLQEAEILKGYQHPNIVNLIGVCAQHDPVYIVMEFMPGGSFLDFLRKKGSQQSKKKICDMIIDACKGMVYLEQEHCIHRDLAARNCLVGESDIVKISDFGMSRESEDSEYTVQSGTRAIPIKWTAPEALNYGKYTPSSDVWSFGIMLWEAYSCGSAPYPGMNNQDARMEIENGYRMPPPADCPQEVFGVMLQCWQYDPEERPDFQTVLNMLEQAHTSITN